VTPERVLGTYGAVVRTLRTDGHTELRPSEGSALIKVEKSEFLFHSEPGFFIFLPGEPGLSFGTRVGWKGFSSGSVGITHYEDIISSVAAGTEGVLKDTARTKDDLRVISRSLVSGRSIEVPLGKLLNSVGLGSWESTGLGTSLTLGIDPNVFSKNSISWEWKRIILGNDSRIQGRLSSFLLQDNSKGSARAGESLWAAEGSDRGHGGHEEGS
jgi:hypothetical protein